MRDIQMAPYGRRRLLKASAALVGNLTLPAFGAASSEGNTGAMGRGGFSPVAGTDFRSLTAHVARSGTWPYLATVFPTPGSLPRRSGLKSTEDGQVGFSVLSTWPDGSAAVVVVAGTKPFHAGTSSLTLELTDTQSPGLGLTPGRIGELLRSVEVDCGPIGMARLTRFLSPAHIWWSNAQVICARYRVAVGKHATLEAVIDVHAFASDHAHVEVVLENGKLHIAAPAMPASADYVATVRINERVVRSVSSAAGVGGTHQAFRAWYCDDWVGGDPEVRITHAPAALQAHPLLYACDQPARNLSAYGGDRYQPWSPGRHRATNMGATGDHPSIGPLPLWEACYLQSGDPAAAGAVVANALAVLGYNINYRDASSGFVPDAQQLAGRSQQNGANSAGHWPRQGGTSGPMEWELAHHPAAGLLAFACQASPVFIEIAQKIAVFNGTFSTSVAGFGISLDDDSGAFGEWGQMRGRAWGVRSLAHATFLSPGASSWRAGGKVWLNRNRIVQQAYANSPRATLGTTWARSPEKFSDHQTDMPGGSTAVWQHHYLTTEFHKAASCRLLDGAEQTALEAVADWLARQPVRWINEQPNGGWRYVPYTTPVSSSATDMLSAADWGTQMSRWHGDAPPAIAGGWHSSSGNTPTSYRGYGANRAAGAFYPSYLWAALVAAVERGVVGAGTAWSTVNAQVTDLSAWRAGFAVDPRWGAKPRNT